MENETNILSFSNFSLKINYISFPLHSLSHVSRVSFDKAVALLSQDRSRNVIPETLLVIKSRYIKEIVLQGGPRTK